MASSIFERVASAILAMPHRIASGEPIPDGSAAHAMMAEIQRAGYRYNIQKDYWERQNIDTTTESVDTQER